MPIATKLLFLFAVFTVVLAVPHKPNWTGKLGVEKYLKELQLSAKQTAAKPAAETLNERNFRLPNNTEPISYNVRLSTDIQRGVFGYQGDVTINIIALEATNNITLHSRYAIIERIDVFNPNGTIYQADLPYVYDSEVHFLVIPVIRALEAGQELIVEISYQGFIRSELYGFFRNSYFDQDTNEEHWLATTQLSPTYARHVFPCYDEIRYRTPILLQIRHHRSYNAISNMPVALITEEDGEYVTSVFQETPPIATYTLSFTVSNFAFVENNDTSVAFRVYARPEAIQLGQADDALRLGRQMFERISGIWDIPVPIQKSDQIAIPTLGFAGFEGWGLITHAQNFILQFNNDTDAQVLRDRRAAHEYAHIYFGNMVTPSQWAYIWLSEGMATLYEAIFTTGWQLFIMDYYDQAITIDVNGLLPPLIQYVQTPEDILGKFHFGIWYKSSIIFRMIGECISRDTWLKAVGIFIRNNQMSHAAPEDLYASLQEAYDEDYPERSLNLTEMMSPWFEYEGYPVVTVTLSNSSLGFTQEGFRTLHNHTFPVPINYATASHPDFEITLYDFWMTTDQLEISLDSATKNWTNGDWIIVNLRDSYYYVTNYDDTLWGLIIDALINDHGAIHFLNRGTLFADFHRFIAQNFDVSMTYFLRMVDTLPLEFEPHVWNRAALGLDLAEVRLRGSEFDSEYRNFMRNVMSQIYGERSFTDRSAMDLINDLSCFTGVQECLDDALDVLIEVMETGHTDFDFNYQCNGLRAANESIWTDFYYSVVDTNSTEARSIALRDLLCSENESVVRFYLGQALNTTNSLSTTERELILATAAVQHEVSFFELMILIPDNNEQINEITSLSTLILNMAMVSNTYAYTEEVLSLFNYALDDDVTEELIRETMQENLNFIYRNQNGLRQFFGARNINGARS